MAALVFVLPAISSDPVVYGLTLAAWSAVIGFIGFGAVIAHRYRTLSVFGVRRASVRWLLISLATSIGTLVLKRPVNRSVIALPCIGDNAQEPYYDARSGGPLAFLLTFIFLSFLVPLGEGLLFRGVLMRGLLRYGPFSAVTGSSVVFALAHGINLALPSALVVGIVAAEVLRWSGSGPDPRRWVGCCPSGARRSIFKYS